MSITTIPPELVEHILLECDPLDVSAFSQTSHYFNSLINHSPDSHLWRLLYLQYFDDRRICVNQLGLPSYQTPSSLNDWKGALERRIRARTVLNDLTKCRKEERCEVLETMVEVIRNIKPVSSISSDDLSQSIVWATSTIRYSRILEHKLWPLSPRELQLRAVLHTHYGLTLQDSKRWRHVESRAFVYNMRNYKDENDFGPFLMDGSGRVNWVHVKAVHHVMSMHIEEVDRDGDDNGGEEFAYTIYQMSLAYCHSVLSPTVGTQEQSDWAGVAGRWIVSFAFCDHRELLSKIPHPLDTSIFSDPDFVEVFRSLTVDLVITSISPSSHPDRPTLHFSGTIMGTGDHVMVGSVQVTPDDCIRWHFVSGEQGNPIWSSEGVQIGGVRSPFGVLGSWTTVFHDEHDPVGASWLRLAEDNRIDQCT
ncbi:hypothetical protein JAAARDRAFT_141889 [Jaapia argillacea MUCL 33604]|uniref:F-box domain-containing protein n=1 Tax=Jaapia argillacea MUCL 33604 TaxID=933084 RepID=A0A067P6H9_9AGAM|nr:hypothetical protein JAAARDRAFT_141889 [Jaapia argillacea MUCL 33604]